MELNSPRVSIIMPAYNAADYIVESINSILIQSFSDLELLIIDDKSEDNTINIINKFKDSRIKLFRNEKNLGQSISKNSLIPLTKGKYIAFIDADDVCHPDKLKIQINFLEKNENICGTGTWAMLINAKGDTIGKVTLPVNSDTIKAHTLFYPCFVHGSIMVRRKEFYDLHGLYYNPDYLYSQDYELFTRSVHKVTIINIPQYLYYLRKWPQQISKKHNSEQIDYFIKGLKQQLQKILKIDLDEIQTEILRITCRNREHNTLNENSIEIYFELLNQIWRANLKYSAYNYKILKVYLMQQYLDAFSLFRGDFSKYLSCYFQFEKILFEGANLKNRLKMAKRYLLGLMRKIRSEHMIRA